MSVYNAKIIHEQGASVLRIASGGSLKLDSGAGLFLGDNVQVMFAASGAAPSGLPVSASPGAIFIRSDGANSAGYVNTSSGTAGSVWTIFSEL